MGIVYSIVAISLIYWIDKFHISRYRTVPYDLGSELPEGMTDMLEIFIPLYCVNFLLNDL